MSGQDESETRGPANSDEPNRREGTFEVGLLGGSVEKRAAHSKIPALDLPHVLGPFRREGDDEKLRAFVAHRPLHIEIGFGRPHHLCDLAAQVPDAHVLGIEIRRRWVRSAAKRADREGLDNLRAIEGDARPVISRFVQPASVDAYYILFPDPWWKKKHHKRRIFRPDFLATLHETLTPGGHLVAKTDVPAYADLIEEQLWDEPGWDLAGSGTSDPVLADLPKSHREKKCLELGIPVRLMRFVKTA